MTREELNWVLEPYMRAFSERWIHIEFPDRDRQHLLSFYN